MDDGHSDRCEMILRCSFDSHFSNSKQCSASFYVFISHLHDFFWVNVCLGLWPTMPSFWLTACLLIKRMPTPLSLWVCVSTPASDCDKCTLSLCVLHTLCRVSNDKLSTCFYSFCLLETTLLSNRDKSWGHFASSLWPLVGVGVQDSWFPSRLPRFHSWGMRSLFRTAHYFPSKIKSAFICQMFISAWF